MFKQTIVKDLNPRLPPFPLCTHSVFMIYPMVSRKVLAMFQCRTINGENYLVADFKLRCLNAEWYK